eukprot:6183487-Alexandrium_andersonii.AAC.1
MGGPRPPARRRPVLRRRRRRNLAHPGTRSAQLRCHHGAPAGLAPGHVIQRGIGGRPAAGSLPALGRGRRHAG